MHAYLETFPKQKKPNENTSLYMCTNFFHLLELKLSPIQSYINTLHEDTRDGPDQAEGSKLVQEDFTKSFFTIFSTFERLFVRTSPCG